MAIPIAMATATAIAMAIAIASAASCLIVSLSSRLRIVQIGPARYRVGLDLIGSQLRRAARFQSPLSLCGRRARSSGSGPRSGCLLMQPLGPCSVQSSFVHARARSAPSDEYQTIKSVSSCNVILPNRSGQDRLNRTDPIRYDSIRTEPSRARIAEPI